VDQAALHLDAAGELDLGDLLGPHHLPRVGAAQPVVRPLHLVALLQLLAEDAVLVAQAVADGGDRQRRQAVDEAGGEAAQAAVAQAGVRLHLGELERVDLLLAHQVADERLGEEVGDVVGERAADEVLHRQVVDALGVGLVLVVAGGDPARGEQVADGAGDGLVLLAEVGPGLVDDVVEDEVALVGGVGVAAEEDFAGTVLVEDLGEGRHRGCSVSVVGQALQPARRTAGCNACPTSPTL
jgi:hypothetical protein